MAWRKGGAAGRTYSSHSESCWSEWGGNGAFGVQGRPRSRFFKTCSNAPDVLSLKVRDRFFDVFLFFVFFKDFEDDGGGGQIAERSC